MTDADMEICNELVAALYDGLRETEGAWVDELGDGTAVKLDGVFNLRQIVAHMYREEAGPLCIQTVGTYYIDDVGDYHFREHGRVTETVVSMKKLTGTPIDLTGQASLIR